MYNKDRFGEVRIRMAKKYNIELAEYRRVHQWIKYHYGKPQACENPECKNISKVYDWALKKGYGYEKKRENFMRLCRSCHIVYDCTDEKRESLRKFQNTTTKKQCLDCKQEFDLKFSQTLCKECGKERQREVFRQYSKKFPEIQKMRQSSYQKSNKEKVNLYQRNRRRKLRGEKFSVKNVSKLTPADINEIRELYAKGYTTIELAKKFGVVFQTIYYHLKRDAIRNKTKTK